MYEGGFAQLEYKIKVSAFVGGLTIPVIGAKTVSIIVVTNSCSKKHYLGGNVKVVELQLIDYNNVFFNTGFIRPCSYF